MDTMRAALERVGKVRPWSVEREHSIERGLAVVTFASAWTVRAIVGEELPLREMDGYQGWFVTVERITK